MKAIPNPEYEACRKHKVIGYMYNCGHLFPVTDATIAASPEEIEESWLEFEKLVKNFDPYKQVHVGHEPSNS